MEPRADTRKRQEKPAKVAKAEALEPNNSVNTRKTIVLPAAVRRKYANAGLTEAEVQAQISTPEFKSAEERSKAQKEDKNGFTPAQKGYLAKALEDYARAYPENAPYGADTVEIYKNLTTGELEAKKPLKNGYGGYRFVESRRKDEIDRETFIVPDDGTFTITDLQQANRLYQRLTGKNLPKQPKERLRSLALPNATPEVRISKATNKTRAALFSGNLQDIDPNGRNDEMTVNIPIDKIDKEYIAQIPLSSDITDDNPSSIGKGWVEIDIAGQPGYTDGAVALVGNEPFGGKGPHTTFKKIDFSKMVGDKKDLVPVKPIRAVSTGKGQRVVLEFDDGSVIHFKYYNLIKSRFPEVAFSKTPKGAIIATDKGKYVGAVAQLSNPSFDEPRQSSSDIPFSKDNAFSLPDDVLGANPKDSPLLTADDFDAKGNVKPEVVKEIQAERARIESEAKASGTWLKAPNGKPSNLTPHQWVDVRTKRFKKWFGDWLNAQHKKFLLGKPIKTLTGSEFQKGDTPSVHRIAEFYETEFGGFVGNPVLGQVELSKSGIRHSIQSGIGAAKSAAFAAVPDVIERGVLIDTQKNWKGRGYDTFSLAAPVNIAGKANIVSVIVSKDTNGQRFTLHRVDLIENLRQGASKTGARAETVELTQTPAGDVKSILQSIFAVNENDVSKVVDENGEPLVVYHGGRLIENGVFNIDDEYGFGGTFAHPDWRVADDYAGQYPLTKGPSYLRNAFALGSLKQGRSRPAKAG